jgi:hypothetical protein
MFRQVFIPTVDNNVLPPINIPREWYGQEVEMIVFPIKYERKTNTENKEAQLLKLCGAWKSEKSAEEIIANIYNSRISGKTHILEEL